MGSRAVSGYGCPGGGEGVFLSAMRRERMDKMDEKQISEHVEQFIGLLESGEYPQVVMENDERGGEWAIGGEPLDDYTARINKPENYAYIANRYRAGRQGV